MKMTATDYAKLRGRSIAWVSEQISKGMPANSVRGKVAGGLHYVIAPSKAIDWELQRAREAARGQRASQRDRLASAQAERVELENARRRGELVLAGQVADVLATLAADLAARHDGLAGRMANELAAITDPAKLRERLLEELRGVRSSFADAIDRLADKLGAEGGESPDAQGAAPAVAAQHPRRSKPKRKK